MIRTYYEGVGVSIRPYSKKVQKLIDEHIRSLNISELINPREITYENFLGYAVKRFKNDKARTALVKNKARQIIREHAPYNPAYYQKLRERLEKIIHEEEKRRKEDASYFNRYKEIYKEALDEDSKRKKLGFSNPFEFSVFEEIKQLQKKYDDEGTSKAITKEIYEKIKDEVNIVEWETKTSSEKNN